MAHSLSRRGGTCDEARNGLDHILFDPCCRILFGSTANLTDHDDRIGIRILVEGLQAVDKSVPFTGSPPMPTHVL